MARRGRKDALDITVLGDKDLARRLRLFNLGKQKTLFRRAARQAMRATLAETRAAAPSLSGRHRATLKLRTYENRRHGQVGVAIYTGTRDELNISHGDPYYYPSAVEFGHAPPGKGQFYRPDNELPLWDEKGRVRGDRWRRKPQHEWVPEGPGRIGAVPHMRAVFDKNRGRMISEVSVELSRLVTIELGKNTLSILKA